MEAAAGDSSLARQVREVAIIAITDNGAEVLTHSLKDLTILEPR